MSRRYDRMKYFKKYAVAALIAAAAVMLAGCSLVESVLSEIAPDKNTPVRTSSYNSATFTMKPASASAVATATAAPQGQWPLAGVENNIVKHHRLYSSQKQNSGISFVSHKDDKAYLIVKLYGAGGIEIPAYSVPLAESDIIYPMFNSSGTRLAFITKTKKDAAGNYSGELFIYDVVKKEAAATGLSLESPEKFPFAYYWRTDDTMIVRTGIIISVYNVNTKEKTELLADAYNFVMSPDKRLAMFATYDSASGRADTKIYNFNTGVTDVIFTKTLQPSLQGDALSAQLEGHYFIDNRLITSTVLKEGKTSIASYDFANKIENVLIDDAYDPYVTIDDTSVYYMKKDANGIPKVYAYMITPNYTREVEIYRSSYEAGR